MEPGAHFPGKFEHSFRSADHPDYKRYQEDPQRAEVCPACAGQGEMPPGSPEAVACPTCNGIGQVVREIDANGMTTLRHAFFVHGPSRKFKMEEPRTPCGRKYRNPLPSSFRISFIPAIHGSIEEMRLREFLRQLVELGKKGAAKADGLKTDQVQPTEQRREAVPLPRRWRRSSRQADQDDSDIPCPS